MIFFIPDFQKVRVRKKNTWWSKFNSLMSIRKKKQTVKTLGTGRILQISGGFEDSKFPVSYHTCCQLGYDRNIQ